MKTWEIKLEVDLDYDCAQVVQDYVEDQINSGEYLEICRVRSVTQRLPHCSRQAVPGRKGDEMIITLTPQERDRFIQWLNQEADSNALLIEQMKKTPIGEPVVKMKEMEIAACRAVSHILSSIVDVSIGG